MSLSVRKTKPMPNLDMGFVAASVIFLQGLVAKGCSPLHPTDSTELAEVLSLEVLVNLKQP